MCQLDKININFGVYFPIKSVCLSAICQGNMPLLTSLIFSLSTHVLYGIYFPHLAQQQPSSSFQFKEVRPLKHFSPTQQDRETNQVREKAEPSSVQR